MYPNFRGPTSPTMGQALRTTLSAVLVRGAVLSLTLAAAQFVMPAKAFAQAAAAATATADLATGTKKKKRPSDEVPLSGTVRVNPSLGSGSLVLGAGNRPSLDVSFGYTLVYAIGKGLNLTASQLFNKNVWTNADSGASRPYDTTFGDVLVTLGWSPRLPDSKGEWKPITLPGGLRMNTSLTVTIPTSRASDYLGRYTTLTPAVSFSKGGLLGDKLSLIAGIAVINNFNKATTAILPNTPEFAGYARLNGQEVLQGGEAISTGQALTSFATRSLAVASLQLTKRINFSLTYLMFNGFRYYDAPKDDKTSIHAKGGRGRVDQQWGIASLGYTLDEEGHTDLSVSTFTASSPFSADNKTYRFPFWDFRSTADNNSSLGITLSHSF